MWSSVIFSGKKKKIKWIYQLLIDTRPKVIDSILGKNINAEVNVVSSSHIFQENSHSDIGKLFLYQIMYDWPGEYLL